LVVDGRTLAVLKVWILWIIRRDRTAMGSWRKRKSRQNRLRKVFDDLYVTLAGCMFLVQEER